MKKLFLTFIFLFALLFTNKTNALELPGIDEALDIYQVYGETNEISFNFPSTGYEFKYDETKVQKLDEVTEKTTFVVLNPTSTRIFIYKNGIKVKVVALEFVLPTTVSLAIDENGAYYVVNAGSKLYGDFDWLVDGKEVVANSVFGEDVKLIYNNKEVTYIVESSGLFNDYFIIIVGFPLFILIVGYVTVLILPINYYKRIYRNSVHLKHKLAKKKNKKLTTFYIYLKMKTVVITNYIDMIPDTCPKYKDFKKIGNELSKTTENIGKVLNFFPEDSIIELVNYYCYKLDILINLLDNGSYKFKESKRNLKVLPTIKKSELAPDREQLDAYHYLEGIDIIRKED